MMALMPVTCWNMGSLKGKQGARKRRTEVFWFQAAHKAFLTYKSWLVLIPKGVLN